MKRFVSALLLVLLVSGCKAVSPFNATVTSGKEKSAFSASGVWDIGGIEGLGCSAGWSTWGPNICKGWTSSQNPPVVVYIPDGWKLCRVKIDVTDGPAESAMVAYQKSVDSAGKPIVDFFTKACGGGHFADRRESHIKANFTVYAIQEGASHPSCDYLPAGNVGLNLICGIGDTNR